MDFVSSLKSIFQDVLQIRRFLLAPLYRILSGSAIWTAARREEYERVFLSDAATFEKEEALLSSAGSLFEFYLLRAFFSLPLDKTHGFHIDVPKWIALKAHFSFGVVDNSFEHDADSTLASIYEPLRHVMVCRERQLEDDYDDGKTIAIFRIAPHFDAVCSVSSDVLLGVSRILNVDSRADLTNFYYQVLQRQKEALADQSTKGKILAGKISVVAISYKHRKDHRKKLGIAKNELISALRALHNAASPANPPSQYCIWWDSCLKCNQFLREDVQVQWPAVGLAPYAFFHVLSIRRDCDFGENRFWIDTERCLGGFSKGITAVDVTEASNSSSSIATLVGNAHGDRIDSLWALTNALNYIASGDLHDSRVTFPSDKAALEYTALRQLCTSDNFALYRALYGDTKKRIYYVESIAKHERVLLYSVVHAHLGGEQVIEGNGEASLCEAVHPHRNKKHVQLRHNWLPNSIIYSMHVLKEEIPPHVREQKVVYLFEPGESECILQIYHERETFCYAEAIHGVVSNLDSEGVSSISRLHVPAQAQLFDAFRALCEFASQSPINSVVHVQNIKDVGYAIAWLWKENEMGGDTSKAVMQILPNDWVLGIDIRTYLDRYGLSTCAS